MTPSVRSRKKTTRRNPAIAISRDQSCISFGRVSMYREDELARKLEEEEEESSHADSVPNANGRPTTYIPTSIYLYMLK